MLAPLRSASNCPALVLNADYRPLSYYPLSLWSWQDTIKAVFLERVNILEEYDRVVHSARLRCGCLRWSRSRPISSPRAIPPSPGSTCSCATASNANIAAIPRN